MDWESSGGAIDDYLDFFFDICNSVRRSVVGRVCNWILGLYLGGEGSGALQKLARTISHVRDCSMEWVRNFKVKIENTVNHIWWNS